MSNRLHLTVSMYLTELMIGEPDARMRLNAIQARIKKHLGPDASDLARLIAAFNELMGSKIQSDEKYYFPPQLAEETTKTSFHKKLIGLRQELGSDFRLEFRNTYQCCAFLLLIAFPTMDADKTLDQLTPRIFFFEPTESYDEDGDAGFGYEDRITTRLIVDWCPHTLLTQGELLNKLLEKDAYTGFYDFEETNLHALLVYFSDHSMDAIPPQLLQEKYLDENQLMHLVDFNNLRAWAEQKLIDEILQMNASDYQLGDMLSNISPTAPRYEEAVRKTLSLEGMLLEKLGEDLIDREELVLIAIEQNGQALAHASPRLQHKKDLIEQALRKTPLAILFLPTSIQQDPNWIKLALKGMPSLLIRLDIRSLDEQTRLNLCMQALEEQPIVVQAIPEEIRKQHPELFQLALKKDDRTVIFASSDDVVPDELIRKAVQRTPLLFRYLSENLRGSAEILRLVIPVEPMLYKYVPDERKSSPELANAALEGNLGSIVVIREYFTPDPSFIKGVLSISPFLIGPDFITSNYAHVPGLMEEYLAAMMGQKNSALEQVADMETFFYSREEDLREELFLQESNFHGHYYDLPF